MNLLPLVHHRPILFTAVSHNQSRHHIPLGNDSLWTIEPVVYLAAVVNPQALIQGRQNVTWNRWIFDWISTRPITCAENKSGLESSTGKQDRVAMIPMISTGIVVVDLGCPAKVSHDGDNRPLQHASFGKFRQQSTACRVELWQQSSF